jgi:hypothetical protein
MTAAVPVLLVSTVARWLATARAPRMLAKAGFEVTLLTPRNSLAESSRFVTRVAHLPVDSTTSQWIHAFAATVKASSPAIVVPCDDLSFRLLAMLVVSPPAELRPALQIGLTRLIRDSLGDPAHYRTSVDRTLLAPAAVSAGVPVPVHAVIATPEDAERFADLHGYPVVTKRAYAAAGNGARMIAGRDELIHAIAEPAPIDAGGLAPDAPQRVLIQTLIDGHIRNQHVAAWQGRVLAGYASERVATHAGTIAGGEVVRYHDDAALRDSSERLVAAFGMTGIFTGVYVIERDTQKPWLLEISRCIGPGAHYGAALNVDLGKALYAAMNEAPPQTRRALDPGEERIRVQFPDEWLRDPGSPLLRRYPVDAPWDDPELLEAMFGLRSER